MLFICACMSLVCHLYNLVVHSYVTHLWFYHEPSSNDNGDDNNNDNYNNNNNNNNDNNNNSHDQLINPCVAFFIKVRLSRLRKFLPN